MIADCFADTNLWIYAHLQVPGDSRCAQAARLVREEGLTISNQVLHEYYSVMLKNKSPDALIQRNIARMIERCNIFCLDLVTLEIAMNLRKRFHFSWWDSLIVASALQSGCTRLYTEDLQHGQIIDGLTIANPFVVAD